MDGSRVNAQARRLDGGTWRHIGDKKAWTLPGSRVPWPIGTREARSFPFVVLVEGGPDLLAAHHFITAENRENEVAAVAMLGASNHIPQDALNLLANKWVRLFPHADPAGTSAAGRTSSSDGQRFRAGSQAESTGHVNPKYGAEPGRTFYTHVSDQYAPFHAKVINVGVRDATYVLDGLLYHESDLRIEEHYTDTAGFTDHLFALMHLLGFRFAPRIRDLGDTRLYVPKDGREHPALAALIGGPLQCKLIRTHWEEILRLAASIKAGTVTASLMLRKLGSYPTPERAGRRPARTRAHRAHALHPGLASKPGTVPPKPCATTAWRLMTRCCPTFPRWAGSTST